MIFLTYWYVWFFASAIPVYWALHAPRLRLLWLLLVSAVFHGHFAGAAGVAPIVVLGVVTFLAGRSGSRRGCEAAIALSVLALVAYKYLDFLTLDLIGLAHPRLGEDAFFAARSRLPETPPLGLSFFVFEFVHYLVDVRGGSAPIASPVEFALFAIFFPSLVAGPIKRYHDFLPSLARGAARVSPSDVAQGAARVAVGYFKKVVVADNLTAAIADWVPRIETFPLALRWAVLVAIAIRLLADFSGYSDIAIGSARMLGVRLPENFDWPYLATSPRDFWRRWHMSLSSWIRDYVYIPLGGARVSASRRVSNALVAFALFGLWHGAAWHYVVWGVSQGLGVVINDTYRSALGGFGERLGSVFDRLPALGWALTMLYFWFGLLVFFYPVEEALRILRALFVP